MNQRKLADFNTLFAELNTSLTSFVKENFDGETTIKCTVQDPIYCRTFELSSYYEFQDYAEIDLGNVDFQLEFTVNRDGNVLHKFGSVRLTTYPGVSAVLCICHPNSANAESLMIIIKLTEQLSKALGARQLILNARNNEVDEANLKQDKWTRFGLVKTYSGDTQMFLMKYL